MFHQLKQMIVYSADEGLFVVGVQSFVLADALPTGPV